MFYDVATETHRPSAGYVVPIGCSCYNFACWWGGTAPSADAVPVEGAFKRIRTADPTAHLHYNHASCATAFTQLGSAVCEPILSVCHGAVPPTAPPSTAAVAPTAPLWQPSPSAARNASQRTSCHTNCPVDSYLRTCHASDDADWCCYRCPETHPVLMNPRRSRVVEGQVHAVGEYAGWGCFQRAEALCAGTEGRYGGSPHLTHRSLGRYVAASGNAVYAMVAEAPGSAAASQWLHSCRTGQNQNVPLGPPPRFHGTVAVSPSRPELPAEPWTFDGHAPFLAREGMEEGPCVAAAALPWYDAASGACAGHRRFYQVSNLECVNIGGNLYVDDTTTTSLDGLAALRRINGSLYLRGNARLQSFRGLDGLTTVGRLSVQRNGALPTDAFGALRVVTSTGGDGTCYYDACGSKATCAAAAKCSEGTAVES